MPLCLRIIPKLLAMPSCIPSANGHCSSARAEVFETPVDLLEEILEEVYEYGKAITGNPDLRKTFALNALVGVDNAAWLLYAAENGITSFDELIPEAYRPALSHHHEKVASIPLMAYSIPISEIKAGRRRRVFLYEDQDRSARHPGGDASEGHGTAFGHPQGHRSHGNPLVRRTGNCPTISMPTAGTKRRRPC